MRIGQVLALSAAGVVTNTLAGCHPRPAAPDVAGPSLASQEATVVSLAAVTLPASDPRIGIMGRAVVDGVAVQFGFPGVTARVCFRGNRLWLRATSSQGRSRLAVVHQGRRVGEVVLPKTEAEILIWEAAPELPVNEQCVDVVHLTETWIGLVTLASFRVEGEPVAAAPFESRRLLFIGDSVTCGEAVRRKPECSKDETWWDAYDAYGPSAARRLNAQYQLVCFGGRGLLRDWQGQTDVLNGPEFFPLAIPDERRLPYSLASYVPDGIVVSLGTNDFNPALGAFPTRREFVSKYVTFVRTLLAAYPGAKLWLTEGAIVSDETVVAAPKGATMGASAKQKATLSSYLEDVVAQVGLAQVRHLPALHYPADTCDAHPLAAEHARMAVDIAQAIREPLGW